MGGVVFYGFCHRITGVIKEMHVKLTFKRLEKNVNVPTFPPTEKSCIYSPRTLTPYSGRLHCFTPLIENKSISQNSTKYHGQKHQPL